MIINDPNSQSGNHNGKLTFDLTPNMRADVACKMLYSQLLTVIRANGQDLFTSTDSECLHDFRVAVRKTRAGLGQLKGTLPDSISLRYTIFFAWLGQATSPTRDLEVYLLNFDGYKNALPPSMREDLNPFQDFLRDQQQRNLQELAEKLSSSHYALGLSEWGEYLQQPTTKQLTATQPNAERPIKELADRRIRKLCQRVLYEGDAITESSAADTFHELRKTCKKLRYIMEFFRTLYPERKFKGLLNKLKGLQEVLGLIQDSQVHVEHIKQFRQKMRRRRIPAPTRLAMEALIQTLEAGRHQARQAFAEKFAAFKQDNNQQLFGKH